ncbi:MAG: enoyl-CoA hydratase-related protein [Solirubrobacterales bacterium]
MSSRLAEIRDEGADLLVERRGQVAVLTLNRPDKMNALLATMVDQLRVSLEEAAADDEIRAAMITGAGRGFCAGADLEFADGDVRQLLLEHYSPLIEAMTSLELPIVAGINGTAAGVGISVALACDMAIAAEGAGFTLAFSRVGLIPDGGMTWVLPRLIGRARAFELMSTSMRFDAARALELGLVSRLTASEALFEETLEQAAELAAGPRALGLLKRALNASPENSLPEQLDVEADLQGEAVASADCAEAIAAFREKREPKFSGR